MKLPLCATLLALLIVPDVALGYSIALVPARGPGDEALLSELDQAVRDALAGHELQEEASVQAALAGLGLSTVETQKDADQLGVKLSVTFVVAPWITPLAGQNRVEILVYFLPDGRAEMLEQIAIEGELGAVVADMISKLVTKEGLLSSETAPPPEEPSGEPGPEPAEEDPSDEELLEQIEEIGSGEDEQAPPPKPGFGDPFRANAALIGGWTLLLNEPATGRSTDRHHGLVGASIGYVVVGRVGLEIGGDVHLLIGPSYGFGLSPAIAIHLPVHERILLGARLGIGFYKGITGKQRASMLVRGTMLTEVILHERVFLRFEIPALTLLALGDKDTPAVGLLGLNAGVGFRF